MGGVGVEEFLRFMNASRFADMFVIFPGRVRRVGERGEAAILLERIWRGSGGVD